MELFLVIEKFNTTTVTEAKQLITKRGKAKELILCLGKALHALAVESKRADWKVPSRQLDYFLSILFSAFQSGSTERSGWRAAPLELERMATNMLTRLIDMELVYSC
jgi:hypothetical protein